MVLREIARRMAERAKVAGRAVRELSGGLQLDLAWVGGYKVLRVSREDGMPGDAEIRVCREAFEVPAEVNEETGLAVVTLRWRV